MPRQPDRPCATCDTLMWRGTGSLPQGQATCRPCRKERASARADREALESAAYTYLRPYYTQVQLHHAHQYRAQEHRLFQLSVRLCWSLAGPALALNAINACTDCGLPFETVTGDWEHCRRCRSLMVAEQIQAEHAELTRRRATPKPRRWATVESLFNVCVCGDTITNSQAEWCSARCYMRSRYRKRVGIPLDAPRYARAG